MDLNSLGRYGSDTSRQIWSTASVLAARSCIWTAYLATQREHAPSGFGVPLADTGAPDGLGLDGADACDRYDNLTIQLVLVAAGRYGQRSFCDCSASGDSGSDCADGLALDWGLYDTFQKAYDRNLRTLGHEVVAQLQAMNEAAGADLLHLGLTSSDVNEPAVAALSDTAQTLVVSRLFLISRRWAELAGQGADQPTAGYTHTQLAAPITWGARWAAYSEQALLLAADYGPASSHRFLTARRPTGPVGSAAGWLHLGGWGQMGADGPDGQPSGRPGTAEHELACMMQCALGRARIRLGVWSSQIAGLDTYATGGGPTDEDIEQAQQDNPLLAAVLRQQRDTLTPEGIGERTAVYNWQHTQQAPPMTYRHIWSLADAAASMLRKWARDLRALHLTGEVAEVRVPGQVGSSAMAHKANPIKLEQVVALANVVSGFVAMGRASDETWLEGDVAESASRRVWLPGMWHALDALLCAAWEATGRLQIRYGRSDQIVQDNLVRLGTDAALHRAVAAGVSRSGAYQHLYDGGQVGAWAVDVGVSEFAARGWYAATAAQDAPEWADRVDWPSA